MFATTSAPLLAGEDGETIKPTLSYLASNGIGGILDYAAENDVDAEGGPASRQEPHDLIVARTFDYEGEAACDGHMHTFLKAIRAAAAQESQGFAAIKVRSRMHCKKTALDQGLLGCQKERR